MSTDLDYQKYIKYKAKYLKYKRSLALIGGHKHFQCDYCNEGQSVVAHVAIVLYTDYIDTIRNKKHVYLLLDNKNLWMTPGGHVDYAEEIAPNNKCWRALEREYAEEVGQYIYDSIPSGTYVPYIDYYDEIKNSCTRIYYHNMKDQYNNVQFSPVPLNGQGGEGYFEAKEGKWMELDKVIDGTITNVKHYIVPTFEYLKNKNII